jgi:hypothetical protein
MGDAAPPHAWLTEERLRLYPAALLLAGVAAFAFTVATADGATTHAGRLGGDFPAFFGAGRLVAEGRVHELYDWRVQHASQAGLHPLGAGDEFLAFAYPPFVALPYAALAPLGYVSAYVVHTLAMAGALLAGVLALRPALPRLAAHPFAAFVFAAAVLPMFRAVTGGQNTPLTFCLIALVWRALRDERPGLAGLWLGALLFKPQLGLPLGGLVVVATRGRALPSYLAAAAALWGVGAAMDGADWVGTWWSGIGRFHEMDQSVNAANSVGLLGLLEAWIGPGHPVPIGLGGLASAGLAAALLWVWTRRALPLDARFALTVPGIVLIPPHAMHYDSGLVALAWLALVDRLGREGVALLGGLYLASLAGEARQALGWNPMALVTLATLVASTWVYVQRERSAPAPA